MCHKHQREFASGHKHSSRHWLAVLCNARSENLRTFADFIHTKLLPQKVISQVRSEIVLNEIKRTI